MTGVRWLWRARRRRRLGETAMWILGAFIGGALGYMVERNAWVFGAVVGAGIGWLLGRAGRRPAGDRLAEVERRLERLHSRLDAFDRRLGTLEGAERPMPPAPAA